MKPPTVSQARAICGAAKARAVIVIALGKDRHAIASYGETKAEFQQTAYTADMIADMLEDGYIPVWATAQTEKSRIKAVNRRRLREGIAEGSICARCQSLICDCDCED